MGLGAGFFSLLVAASGDCEAAQRTSQHWICTGVRRDMLGCAEGALVLGAFVGPLLGGIASARHGGLRWILLGAAIGFIAAAFQIQLSEHQLGVSG